MAFSNTCTTTSPAPSRTAAGSSASAADTQVPGQPPQRLRPEERLCSQLIALIEQGVNPWRKPWNPSRCGQHRNLLTAKPYSGSNPALLELQLAMRASDLPLWIGFHQAAAMGWHPRKGSHGCLIYRPLLLPLAPKESQDSQGTPGKGRAETQHTSVNSSPDLAATTGSATATAAPPDPTAPTALRFRPALVFHVTDLQDAPPSRRPKQNQPLEQAISDALSAAPAKPLPERLAAAERQLASWPVPVLTAANQAFYLPSRDQIHLPPRPAFHSPEAFLATWAHEQIHSTGHSSRLNRDGITGGHPPHSAAYAREELIAELGAFLLTQRLAIGSEITQHAAYLGHWATLLGQSPSQLRSVLAEASRAVQLLSPEPTPNS